MLVLNVTFTGWIEAYPTRSEKGTEVFKGTALKKSSSDLDSPASPSDNGPVLPPK